MKIPKSHPRFVSLQIREKLVEGFENNLVLHSEISTLLYSWALRCGLESIIEQSLFNPFPKNLLLDLMESKKEYSVL